MSVADQLCKRLPKGLFFLHFRFGFFIAAEGVDHEFVFPADTLHDVFRFQLRDDVPGGIDIQIHRLADVDDRQSCLSLIQKFRQDTSAGDQSLTMAFCQHGNPLSHCSIGVLGLITSFCCLVFPRAVLAFGWRWRRQRFLCNAFHLHQRHPSHFLFSLRFHGLPLADAHVAFLYAFCQQGHVVLEEVRQVCAVLRQQDVRDGIEVGVAAAGNQGGQADLREENVTCPEQDYL